MRARKSIVHKIFDQAFNQGDLSVIDTLASDDGMIHSLSWSMPKCRMGLKPLIARLRASFPNLRYTLGDEIRKGDKVAAHWVMYGTQKGAFFSNLPTGRPVKVQGIFLARTADGRTVKDWMLVDQLGLLQELGSLPPTPDHPVSIAA